MFKQFISNYSLPADLNPQVSFGFVSILIGIMIWTMVWKGLALWQSAKEGKKTWFVVLFLINSLGILEIIYLFKFSNFRKDRSNSVSIPQ